MSGEGPAYRSEDLAMKPSPGVGRTIEGGGAHYRKLKIQPIEYIEANDIPFHEANIIKYITRWKDKGGISDLQKVIWYAERLIERENKAT